MKKRIVSMVFAVALCLSSTLPALAEDNSARIAEIRSQIAELQLELDKLTGVANEEGDEKINWIVKNYVDKFSRPTEEQYITTEYYVEGTFSNSAATDSDLKIRFLIDAENIRIDLYEYGDSPVKNYYSKDKYYTLSALDSKGVEHNLNCLMYAEDQELYLLDKDEFCRILEYEGQASFIIDENDGMSEYKFTVNLPSGFSDIYSKIGGEFQRNEEYQEYLDEEESKHINGEVQLSLIPKNENDLEYTLSSELPDGTVVHLILFEEKSGHYRMGEEIDQRIENGTIQYLFEDELIDAVSGDSFEVDAKIEYDNQDEEIQQKLGKGAFEKFCYLDNVKSEYVDGQSVASLNYVTYTIE